MEKRILIVDDDPEYCEGIAEILTQEGYTVRIAFDGSRAEKLIKEDRYDIILLDFKMPGPSGTDILKDIRQKSAESKIFVITGRPFIEELLKEENLSNLITAVISKPYNVSTLLEKIKLA